MAADNIASELMKLIEENEYKTEFEHLNEDRAISGELLKALKKDRTDKRTYDTSRFQTRVGNIIPNGIYSLFTKYAGDSCEEIRDKLSTWVNDHREELRVLTEHSFDNHPYNFGMWNLLISMKKRPK